MASDNDSEAPSVRVRGSDSELSKANFGVHDERSFSSYDSNEDELHAIAGSLQDEDDDKSRGPPDDNYAEPLPIEPPENIEFATDDTENINDDEPGPPAAETPHPTENKMTAPSLVTSPLHTGITWKTTWYLSRLTMKLVVLTVGSCRFQPRCSISSLIHGHKKIHLPPSSALEPHSTST
jgi:hypothetical protein